MTAPASIPRRRLVSILKGLGFEGPFSGGSHDFMKRGAFKLHVPNEHGSKSGGKSVPLSVAKKTLLRAGMTEQEALAALGVK